jgi:hypothetical protein
MGQFSMKICPQMDQFLMELNTQNRIWLRSPSRGERPKRAKTYASVLHAMFWSGSERP